MTASLELASFVLKEVLFGRHSFISRFKEVDTHAIGSIFI